MTDAVIDLNGKPISVGDGVAVATHGHRGKPRLRRGIVHRIYTNEVQTKPYGNGGTDESSKRRAVMLRVQCTDTRSWIVRRARPSIGSAGNGPYMAEMVRFDADGNVERWPART